MYDASFTGYFQWALATVLRAAQKDISEVSGKNRAGWISTTGWFQWVSDVLLFVAAQQQYDATFTGYFQWALATVLRAAQKDISEVSGKKGSWWISTIGWVQRASDFLLTGAWW